MQLPGFIGPSYTLRSVAVDCQRTVNLFPEVDEQQTGKDQEVAALVSTPGLRLYKTLGSGPTRGGIVTGIGRVFAVSGDTLYEAATGDGAPVGRAKLITSRGVVSMADNGVQLCIVDGRYGYIFTYADNTLKQITSDAFMGADRVVFQDGYFIFNAPNTRLFFISDLYDGLSISGLDYGAKEGEPDNIVSLLSDHRELWLFGRRSSEVWFNSGDASFPFSRIQGGFMAHGTCAVHSPQKLGDGTVMWLSENEQGNGIVQRASGFQPQRCSTHAVEKALQSYGDLSDATSWTYQAGGHSFYCLNFKRANRTWVFDGTTQLWHERTYTNPSTGAQERHRADWHVFVAGKHYVGDYANGNVYELTDQVMTDNGASIRRERTTPHVSAGGNRIFASRLLIDMETGLKAQKNEASAVFYPNGTMYLQQDTHTLWQMNVDGTWEKMGTLDELGVLTGYGFPGDDIPKISTARYIDLKSGVSYMCLPMSHGSLVWTWFGAVVMQKGSPDHLAVYEEVITPVEDPQVMLQYSDDGGKKWSDEIWTSAGQVGESNARQVEFRKLGSFRNRVWKVVVTDPLPVTLIAAFLDAEAGRH
jgi:Phage stabilisation protein